MYQNYIFLNFETNTDLLNKARKHHSFTLVLVRYFSFRTTLKWRDKDIIITLYLMTLKYQKIILVMVSIAHKVIFEGSIYF